MSVDRYRINGNALSWGSLIAKVGGEEFHGLIGLSVTQKRERAKVYGTGRSQRARGRTIGKYSIDAKLTVARGSMSDFIEFLKAQSEDGISYGNVEFQLVFQYVETDETPMTIVLNECVIAEESMTDDEGIEGLKDELSLDVMYGTKNGGSLFDSTRR